MKCEYFGSCASCTLYDMTYDEQFLLKTSKEKERFKEQFKGEFQSFSSKEEAFRVRAEFRVWRNFENGKKFEDKEGENKKNKEGEKPKLANLSYAMSGFDKEKVLIKSCEIVIKPIQILMPKLLIELQKYEVLHKKLFAIEFLSSLEGDILVTLIYHKKLDFSWEEKAKVLQNCLDIKILGRSKGQRLILKDDFIRQTLEVDKKTYKFLYKEGGFIQPNQEVNKKMLTWVLKNASLKGDLCELYCGAGNFTIILSKYFNKVLASEISKTSIKNAKQNCEENNIKNIVFLRMSSEEFVEAFYKTRVFNRLKNIDLETYNFSTIFLDPPRSGLDDASKKLAKDFRQIIYISCNPESLYEDLDFLSKSHKIIAFGFFDQFAYTKHLESGVILNKI